MFGIEYYIRLISVWGGCAWFMLAGILFLLKRLRYRETVALCILAFASTLSCILTGSFLLFESGIQNQEVAQVAFLMIIFEVASYPGFWIAGGQILLSIWFIRLAVQEQRTRHGLCWCCGYNLAGSSSAECSECGCNSSEYLDRQSHRRLFQRMLLCVGVAVALSQISWQSAQYIRAQSNRSILCEKAWSRILEQYPLQNDTVTLDVSDVAFRSNDSLTFTARIRTNKKTRILRRRLESWGSWRVWIKTGGDWLEVTRFRRDFFLPHYPLPLNPEAFLILEANKDYYFLVDLPLSNDNKYVVKYSTICDGEVDVSAPSGSPESLVLGLDLCFEVRKGSYWRNLRPTNLRVECPIE